MAAAIAAAITGHVLTPAGCVQSTACCAICTTKGMDHAGPKAGDSYDCRPLQNWPDLFRGKKALGASSVLPGNATAARSGPRDSAITLTKLSCLSQAPFTSWEHSGPREAAETQAFMGRILPCVHSNALCNDDAYAFQCTASLITVYSEHCAYHAAPCCSQPSSIRPGSVYTHSASNNRPPGNMARKLPTPNRMDNGSSVEQKVTCLQHRGEQIPCS